MARSLLVRTVLAVPTALPTTATATAASPSTAPHNTTTAAPAAAAATTIASAITTTVAAAATTVDSAQRIPTIAGALLLRHPLYISLATTRSRRPFAASHMRGCSLGAVPLASLLAMTGRPRQM